MNRQRHSSGMSPMCFRNPAKVSQRYGWIIIASARRQNRCTSAAPASRAAAALSKAEAPAPSTATTRPRNAAKSTGSAAWARSCLGRSSMKSGIHQRPVPSCPVASTILRASSVSPVASSVRRHEPPQSVRAGVMPVTLASLRTGRPVTRRNHSRYAAQFSVGISGMSAKCAAPHCASCQAW